VFENSNIIFTKLDECDRFGAIYDVVEKTGIPISYFTVGQNVPEDIEKATSERIAELILGR
jgi:flagellar biosynthesis protein FlhF